MKFLTRISLILFILILTGCSIVPPRESETIWAQLGSSARVLSDKKIEVTDKNPNTANGETVLSKDKLDIEIDSKKSKINPQGMILIDEPTYLYYKDLHKQFGKK